MRKSKVEASITNIFRCCKVLALLLQTASIRILSQIQRPCPYLGSHSIPYLGLLFIAVYIPRLGRRIQNEQVERANSNEVTVSAEVCKNRS